MAERKYTINRKPPAGLKYCAKGDHLLPATPDYFPVRSQYRDGLSYWCADCIRAAQRESHQRRKPPCPNCGLPKQKDAAMCRNCFEQPKELTDAEFLRTPNGCLEFQGARNPNGYGMKNNELTHRAIWERSRGPIPDGLCVLHHCDNPPCGDLTHLFLGTRTDNAVDKTRKGRASQKLAESDVLAIRRLTHLSSAVVGARFKVSQTTICKIWRRESWAWLL